MLTLCLMHQIGTKKQTVISLAQDLKQTDRANVYFCVRSESAEEAQAVAYAVQAANDVIKLGLSQAVHNANGLSFSVIEPGSWYEDSWRPNAKYVYLYTSPASLDDEILEPYKLWSDKNIFYVGEGSEDELFGLIHRAAKKLDDFLSKQTEDQNMHLVQRFILCAGKASARNMVRKIAFFSGEHEAVACAAVKGYLIHHLYGLEKKGKPNAIHGSCDWITRPKDVLANTSEWQGMLSDYFCSY